MTQLTPISGNYQAGKGLIYFQKTGSDVLEELGDVDGFSLAIDVERLQRFSNQFAARTQTDSRVQQQTYTLSMTLMQHTARNRAMGVMSDVAYQTQSAGTTSLGSLTTTQVAVGDIFDLGKMDITSITLTDGLTAATTFTQDTHFKLDAQAGLIEILELPGGSGAGLVATYAYSAISAASKRLYAGIGSSPDLEGKIYFRGVNATGKKVYLTINKVKLAPSGERQYISDEYSSIEMTGDCTADTTQPTGYEIGYERELAS